MDRRFSLILGLGMAVLGASAGCTPSFNSRTPNPPPSEQSKKDSPTPPAVTTHVSASYKEKELPKRQPTAACCVAAGEFFFRESLAPNRTPQDQP